MPMPPSSPSVPKCLSASLPLFLLLPLAARAQSTSALLNEALDKQVNIQFNETLPSAMKKIAAKTGVRIEAETAVWDLLPWGEQTNISANVSGITLRDALTAIARKLGLRFELQENAVVLKPTPALARLGRRSTVQELQLLDLLTSTPLKMDTTRPTLRQVIDGVDAQLAGMKSDFVLESRIPAEISQDSLIPVPRGASLSEALEAIGTVTRVTWYPWGKSVVVLPKEDQIRILLQKPITVRYTGADVGQVLLELSKLAGVPFAIEAGAVQRVPPEFRSVKLTVDNASIQQVLESLSATTGLGYVVTDRNIYFWNSSPIPGGIAQPAANAAPGRITLLIPLPDGTQLVLPNDDLPEDVKEYLKAKKAAEVERLRAKMKQEGFKPTTRPEDQKEDL